MWAKAAEKQRSLLIAAAVQLGRNSADGLFMFSFRGPSQRATITLYWLDPRFKRSGKQLANLI